MAYPQSSLPKGSTSTKGRNPLKNPLGENIPSIIENRGTRPTISIRKGNLKNPKYHGHSHDDDDPAFDPYEGYPSGYDTD